VHSDFDGPDEALPAREVRGVVQGGVQLTQYRGELFCALPGQFTSQHRVLGYGGHAVSPQDRLDVEPRPADEDRHPVPRRDLAEARVEALLELEDAEEVVRLGHVDEVVRDGDAVDDVLREVLARADVHAPVDLAGVGGDQLGPHPGGQPRGQARLARCRGPEDDDEVAVSVAVTHTLA